MHPQEGTIVIEQGSAQWHLKPAKDAGREGMVTVWDHNGLYLGCMGTETWEASLHPEGNPDSAETLRSISASEFVSARDASRALGKLIDRLEAREIAKAIILDRNTPRAVILAFSEFVRLSCELERWVPQRDV